MTITFIAAPLVSPGGVYHSVTELVAAARAEGHDWRALIVARGWSAHDVDGESLDGVRIIPAQHRRVAGLRELTRIITTDDWVRASDTIVTLIPQSDLVYALNRRRMPPARWIAYLRGLPWPEPGEAPAAVRLGKRAIAKLSLRAADEKWSVSTVLARQVGLPDSTPVIPPGIDVDPPDIAARPARPFTLGWMGRFEPDKDPMFFVELVRATGMRGVMYGTGRLRAEVEQAAGPDIEIRPWADRDEALASMDVYVGTSTREAFGRIPIEAAAFGVPSILANNYGCAAQLYSSDSHIKGRLVLDKSNQPQWFAAIEALAHEPGLHSRSTTSARTAAAQLTTSAAVSLIVGALSPLRSQCAEHLNGHTGTAVRRHRRRG